MQLSGIKCEDFTEIIGILDDQPGECQQFYLAAMAEVPLIKHLMGVYSHAVESKTPKLSIEMDKAALSIPTALYLLEKNADASESQG